MLAVLVLAVTIGRQPLADKLFAGDGNLVTVLIGALAAMAVAYATRGVLSGLQLFPWYALNSASTAACGSSWPPCSGWPE